MPENVSPTFATTPAFWAAVREQALQEWESEPSRAKWDSIKYALVGVNKCLLAMISPRENTGATELKRIERQVYPELRRLERQVASRMKQLQRQVRAALKRIGRPPPELLALGPNEQGLRSLLDIKPFSLPRPVFFPKNDRIMLAIAIRTCSVTSGRPVNSRDLALASLLIGNKPSLGKGGYDGWTPHEVIGAEQDNMQKADKRALVLGLQSLPPALLLDNCFPQGVPEQRSEVSNSKSNESD